MNAKVFFTKMFACQVRMSGSRAKKATHDVSNAMQRKATYAQHNLNHCKQFISYDQFDRTTYCIAL